MQSSLITARESPRAQSRSEVLSHQQYSLPEWQPDSDVTHCFVCNSQFTLFFRKHHCRRCGRVVCRSCSPHRITMPRQFIVQPPTPSLLQDEEDGEYAASGLGGGEEVRVCNPCVPDPNYSPQITNPVQPFRAFQQNMPPHYSPYGPHHSQDSSGTLRSNMEPSRVFVGASGRTYNRPSRPTGHRTSYSVSNMTGAGQYGPSGVGRTIPVLASDGRTVDLQVPGTISGQQELQPGAYRGSMIPSDLSSFFNSHAAPQDMSTNNPLRRARPQIAEEDECPVCGEELPPKQTSDTTSSREAHIESCLQSHMYSSSAPQERTLQLSPERSQSPAPTESRLAQNAMSVEPANLRSRRMTRGQMLIYVATEKDCAGHDGVAQECVICLEDFEPRQEMARLECLCKFHRRCIREWWNTKGVGSCPTHQLHS